MPAGLSPRYGDELRLIALFFIALPLAAQTWDLPAGAVNRIASATAGRLAIGFEQRERYETRPDAAFVPDGDIATGLARTRVSLSWQNHGFKVAAMMQDARAPWYGAGAPSSVRDTADLQEAYFEVAPESHAGITFAAGRRMLTIGEGRLIGSPQWTNTSRTFDFARAGYVSKRARVEAIFVSPVQVRPDAFNRPVLGARVWGVYSSFPNFWRKMLSDAYVLRHGAVTTAGFRLAGPLAGGWKYSMEGAAQQHALGWYSGVGRRWGRVDFWGEHKFASGANGKGRRTFDQLYPANHDRFGHQDLLGWRNIHNLRALASYSPVKGLAVNVMYNNSWLANPCDALYNGGGRPIARAAGCGAGSHIGQEADIFAVYTHGHFQIGAGYGYFFAGDFVRQTIPGASPTYLYLFHSYSL